MAAIEVIQHLWDFGSSPGNTLVTELPVANIRLFYKDSYKFFYLCKLTQKVFFNNQWAKKNFYLAKLRDKFLDL